MQVFLNTDPNIDGRQRMADHLKAVVRDALGRFGGSVTRVEAHIADGNSQARSHSDQIQCTLEARLGGLQPVVVKDHAATAHQAIDSALVKLKRALTTRLGKLESHRKVTPDPSVADHADATDESAPRQ